uniref:Ribosomal protein S3 n=1 Tax=Blastocrithidia nonstop TaxID=2592485 RepID=A0AAT9USU0_9TRYP
MQHNTPWAAGCCGPNINRYRIFHTKQVLSIYLFKFNIQFPIRKSRKCMHHAIVTKLQKVSGVLVICNKTFFCIIKLNKFLNQVLLNNLEYLNILT